ncbi:hypothetical protein L3X38_025954 [Prunus dulcis]|uniref:DOG1 domain-containing protein n=1 Tax=Prunus dulcis TaxID=3755 RepID=A0AAD4W2M9_PRUDU|nr:hypothetical protein L3X38_025954 [Prunus dulcis]
MTNNIFDEHESFHNFFECWLAEQNQHLQDLIIASENNQTTRNNLYNGNTTTTAAANTNTSLRTLVERVVKHYEQYYEAKSRWVKQDVLRMLSPSWTTSLEDAFLWIGGWRPSMAFHLFYSKSGLQLEARLTELIEGLGTGDLADISQHQLMQVDHLQRRTVKEERDITEKMAKQQESVADTSMLELAHVTTELMSTNGGHEHEVEEDRVESVLASKEQGLEEILQRADSLRLKTLKAITHILTSIQAVHFLIAAAELHLRLHDWGKKKDASSHGNSS